MSPPGPLAGRRVVVTQQRPDPLAAALRARGAVVDHVPLTSVREPSDGGAALSRELLRLDRYDWLVVTSVNGARAVGAAAAARPGVRLAAVGVATADVLAQMARRPVDLVPDAQRAAGLVACFPAGHERVLLAQGDLAGSTAANGLRGVGHEVTVVDAYRTVPRSPDTVELGLLSVADAVVLASGSAARALAAAGLRHVACIAIGPSTEGAVLDTGLTVAAVAESPAVDDVVAAVAIALQRTGATQ